MKKWGKRIGIFFILLFSLIGLVHVLKGTAGKALGILEVEGTMWTSDEWVKQIDDFRKDPHIAGVVVRIQSPGGTVAAAQEIYQAIKQLRATKPVVASMGTIAASGGLYVAMAADTVVADEGTLTGSIGVRMEHVNLEELLRFAKIKYETIKSGHLKDMASFSRPLTTEERDLLEGMMAEIHQQFKKTVAESRHLKLETVDQFADGRIFSGAKAKALGLVDEIGDMGRAIAIAKQKAGIQGEPRLVYSESQGLWWFKALFGTVKAYFSGPAACYLYP